MGSCDPFVMAEFGNAKVVSKHKSNDRNPVYYMKIYVPYTEPCVSENLNLKIYDYDSTDKDDLIGTVHIKKSNFKDFSTF